MKTQLARLDFTATKNLLVGYLTKGRLVGLAARLYGRPLGDCSSLAYSPISLS